MRRALPRCLPCPQVRWVTLTAGNGMAFQKLLATAVQGPIATLLHDMGGLARYIVHRAVLSFFHEEEGRDGNGMSICVDTVDTLSHGPIN